MNIGRGRQELSSTGTGALDDLQINFQPPRYASSPSSIQRSFELHSKFGQRYFDVLLSAMNRLRMQVLPNTTDC